MNGQGLLIRRAVFHTLLGPLNFIHGVPEYGPRQPDPVAFVCGMVGTWLWASPFMYYLGLI